MQASYSKNYFYCKKTYAKPHKWSIGIEMLKTPVERVFSAIKSIRTFGNSK